MELKEIENALNDTLLSLEVTWNKALVMAEDLDNTYFGNSEQESWFLQIRYNEARTKIAITNDYLSHLGKELNKTRTLLNKLASALRGCK